MALMVDQNSEAFFMSPLFGNVTTVFTDVAAPLHVFFFYCI